MISPSRVEKRRNSYWLVTCEYTHVRPYNDLPHTARTLVDQMKQFYEEYRAAEPDEYWRRKSGQVVLAVLQIRSGGKLRHVRGINSELSLPSGSICAERAAICSALSQYLSISRSDFISVAVFSPIEGRNPIHPCGVCHEWIGKIQEESPAFNVVTFNSSTMEIIYVRHPATSAEIEASQGPRRLTVAQNLRSCTILAEAERETNYQANSCEVQDPELSPRMQDGHIGHGRLTSQIDCTKPRCEFPLELVHGTHLKLLHAISCRKGRSAGVPPMTLDTSQLTNRLVRADNSSRRNQYSPRSEGNPHHQFDSEIFLTKDETESSRFLSELTRGTDITKEAARLALAELLRFGLIEERDDELVLARGGDDKEALDSNGRAVTVETSRCSLIVTQKGAEFMKTLCAEYVTSQNRAPVARSATG